MQLQRPWRMQILRDTSSTVLTNTTAVVSSILFLPVEPALNETVAGLTLVVLRSDELAGPTTWRPHRLRH